MSSALSSSVRPRKIADDLSLPKRLLAPPMSTAPSVFAAGDCPANIGAVWLSRALAGRIE
jgi:hypothetical protein